MKKEPIYMQINDNILTFYTHSETYHGKINHAPPHGYYLDLAGHFNDFLFDITGIMDKYAFQEKVLGYRDEFGSFPFCENSKDVIKLIKAMVDFNNGKEYLSLKKGKHIKLNFNL